ncbi:AraC family transcriptional regulator [Actinoplanes friuliensis]|uniref:RhaSlike HTH-type transcriptional activator n=1 Tax=Actinoplanes friuliensis DSM 7358 TaxID=1246995 RepID=U5W1A4_9ACTN|nr:AraC family transcriptional regulator [Actinoplanes friuliensis]AGZ41740.1 RhaSlike HTH-type transcriptional activator [Actinoplanes friuliensis DSM 7358]
MRTVHLNSSDLDQARGMLAEHFYPNVIDGLSPGALPAVDFEITRAGLFTIGDLRFGTDVRLRFGELGAYHVDLPSGGDLLWRQGRREPILATPRSAAVFSPDGDTTLDRWDAATRVLAIKIERPVLEAELERMLDAPVTTPLRLSPELDVSRGAGATWLRLAHLIAADAAQPEGLTGHPVLGRRLRESLVAGLLLAVPHNYRDRLERRRTTLATPRAVQRAIEVIRADPARPFTVADLAAAAGVSARSLQDSFQRHLSTSPMAYLRDVRLAWVHDELRRADPGRTTVTEVAYSCGFLHLGRFAGLYRSRYGVPPSATLRD